jgi:hypothetical protein
MEALVELARDGGYVCACFRTHKQRLLIGKVRANSRIELLYGHYGQEKPGFQGRQAVMKVLQLYEVRELLETDHPTILVGQPQQGTILHWRRVENLIKALVEGERIQVSLNILDTAQQETMCSEFLRAPHSGLPTLVHLLLPVGRTMKIFDIIGLATDGRRIFAQETYSAFKRGDPKFQTLLLSRKGTLFSFASTPGKKSLMAWRWSPSKTFSKNSRIRLPVNSGGNSRRAGRIVMAALASATCQ